jgi:hypothetical protein
MGLHFAKEYINTFDSTNTEKIPVFCDGNEYSLSKNVSFTHYDKIINLQYIQRDHPYILLSYCSEDRVIISLTSKTVHFIVISSSAGTGLNHCTKKQTLEYPWLKEFSAVRITKATEEEYRDNKSEILSLSLFFKE